MSGPMTPFYQYRATAPKERERTVGKQLTSPKTCQQKHMYHSNETAKRAEKRRNKAYGHKYLFRYQCNICDYWHLTTQSQELNPKKES